MTRDEVKQSVSMRKLLDRYGIHINRAGFCCCPFHKEKTPSMKVYRDSYNCFGCGANGDIFSFVMGMEHCDFKTAYVSLGGTYETKDEYRQKLFKYRLSKQKEKKEQKALAEKQLKKDVLEDIRLQSLFKKLSHPFSDIWCDAVNRLEYDFYILDELTRKGV